jgi:5-methylcytosine-specific restriction endonuclease McrA
MHPLPQRKPQTSSKPGAKMPITNKEKRQRYRAKNLETVKASTSKWQKANPEKRRINEHNRRVRLAKTGGRYTETEWVTLCEKHGNACLKCGKVTVLSPDHIVPISKGGSGNIENIQPLCLSCNFSKGTKIEDYRTYHEQGTPETADVVE